MHKSFIGLAAAAGIGLASLAAPAPANAGCFGCAVGVGVLGVQVGVGVVPGDAPHTVALVPERGPARVLAHERSDGEGPRIIRSRPPSPWSG